MFHGNQSLCLLLAMIATCNCSYVGYQIGYPCSVYLMQTLWAAHSRSTQILYVHSSQGSFIFPFSCSTSMACWRSLAHSNTSSIVHPSLSAAVAYLSFPSDISSSSVIGRTRGATSLRSHRLYKDDLYFVWPTRWTIFFTPVGGCCLLRLVTSL